MSVAPAEDVYYSPKQIAALLDRSTRWVERQVADGHLKAEQFDFGGTGRRTTRIRRAEYLAWLEAARSAATP